MFAPLAIITALATAPATVAQDPTDTRMLSQPAVSATHVAFVYAGDLWSANLDGSDVIRLTTADGDESSPVFSPDGSMIAFSGNYDGNVDVYVVPVGGGPPRRLTFHPGVDEAQAFTPDGRQVLFVSGRNGTVTRRAQLFTVPVAGGAEEALPIPSVAEATIAPDGRRIAYNPLPRAFEEWKRYRGGRNSVILLYTSQTHAVEKVPQPATRSNDVDAMWIGNTLYFRSDRDGEFNLYAYDTGAGQVRALTSFTDFPVLAASAGGGRIVYERAGWLYLLDPATAESRKLSIGVPADLRETRPRWVGGNRYIRNTSLSPTGARVALEFRGEIVTVPAEKGDARNLTNSPGANDRSPAWSPDGSRIAWFSDEGGEYKLHVAPQSGGGEHKTYAPGGAGFYTTPRWSPDGSRISYVDNAQAIYVLDLASGRATQRGRQRSVRADSARVHGVVARLEVARLLGGREGPGDRAVRLRRRRRSLDPDHRRPERRERARLRPEREVPVSPGVHRRRAGPRLVRAVDDEPPVDVRHLRHRAAQRPAQSPGARERRGEGHHARGRDTRGATRRSRRGGRARGPGPDTHRLRRHRPAHRRAAGPRGRHLELEAGEAGMLFYTRTADGATALHRYDLGKRKDEPFLPDFGGGYAISADGKKLMYTQDGSIFVVGADSPPKAGQGRVPTADVQVRIDPRAEWAQIFDEAWRINRDYFYAPNMHGVDWNAAKRKYEPFLADAATKADVNRVIQWMMSELSVGHHRGGGGDRLETPPSVPGGLLGADYEVANGRYRFARIYGGLNWNPELRAPLTEPGVDVREGDYLLAVRGVDVRPSASVYSYFENTAGKTVEITVGPNADGSGGRTVDVVPIANEGALRNRAWVEENVRKVDSLSSGRVAYVYVPNTAQPGYDYFKRYFYPQTHKEAIVVDERDNGGGQVADYYIDLLRRPLISWWAMRYGEDYKTPAASIQGPKTLIVNEMAGSGGDLFPWMWHKFGLGPIVGKRTWGGLVGVLGFPILMDGGSITAPNLAIWTAEQGWVVENEGVPPDIEVEQTPADVIAGHDPQLERAVAITLDSLAQHPVTTPTRPAYKRNR